MAKTDVIMKVFQRPNPKQSIMPFIVAKVHTNPQFSDRNDKYNEGHYFLLSM